MAIDPTITVAQAWADDRARLVALKTELETFSAAQAAEQELYINDIAKVAARNSYADTAMRIEQVDAAIARLDELLA